jgi:DNA-directed RNA polymerase I and III subunit RPAC2
MQTTPLLISSLLTYASTTATFHLHGEDHTLGNSLRYLLAKSPSTSFVGYSIPHPSEHVIHLRLQTRLGKSVYSAMTDACVMLEDICDHVLDVFTKAEEKAVAEGRDRGDDEEDDGGGAENHHMEEID